MKKDQNLPNKNVHSNNSSGKPLPDKYNNSRHGLPYRSIFIDVNLQIKEIHEISHRIDKVDLTVKMTSIETTTQDQIQIEVIIQINIEIQFLGIYIIGTTVLETFYIIGTETTQTKEIDKTQIVDHKTIQTIDQTTTIITIGYEIIPEIEILITQINKGITISRHIEIIDHLKVHIKSIEAVHLNINFKLSK